jgi:hypothetical protein
MAIYRARADLGWNPDAANVNTQLANACNNILQSGDTLHLDARSNGQPALYKVSTRQNRFKSGVTITADTGSGFDCIGTSGTGGQHFFEALGNIVLDNVTHTSSSSPETGFNGNNPGTPGTHYHAGHFWRMYSGTSKIIRFCSFGGNLDMFLNMGGAGFDIRNTKFYRTKYQLYCERTVTGLYMKNCLLDAALIDGIKTINSGATPSGWLIEDTIFQESRDGVDIAGGLADSTFNRCIFRYLNVTGLDAKIGLDVGTTSADWDRRLCQNLTLNDCLFVDLNSAVAFTLLNGGDFNLTSSILETYAPKNIVLNRCTHERSLTHFADIGMRIFLVKMGHHSHSYNCIKRNWNGNDEEIDETNEVGGGSSGTVDYPGWSHDNSVTVASVNGTGRAKDFSIPFPLGPGATVPDDPEDPEEPEIPPAPVSAGPALSLSAAGLLSVDPSRLPPQTAKEYTARVTTGHGTASDTFPVTVS